MKTNYSAAVRPLLGGIALLALSLTSASAQPRPAATLLRDAATIPSPLAAALAHARPLTLDVAAARAALAAAPAEAQAGVAPLELALPLPDGTTGRFAVWQTAVMAPALAARYPQIRTYAGRGLDDTTATVRLDLTPHGFHAQVLSAATGTVYIDPARRGDTEHYLSFYQRDLRPGAAGLGGCAAEAPASGKRQTSTQPADRTSGALLRTYKLAMACTGEYAAFHGGTVPLAQAAIVTLVNRVGGIYEKELAVRFQLVANNDQLVYTDAATDPYTNNDPSALLLENQLTVDAVIGSANYDIGHVLGTGGGGVANVAVVCLTGLKAHATSSAANPAGDAAHVALVAHEVGHQFGAGHSFNGTAGFCGNGRWAFSAWEPGSGSTIMSYAGSCGAQNLQPNKDPYFHVGSYEEMRAFIESTTCATITATANTPPVVRVPASGRVLPQGTPFQLTASASDAEGDALTYSWEQLDRGPAGSPTGPQVANQNVPLFRSFAPSASPTRYFPRLSDLVNNTAVLGERLPTVARRLTFKCTARDQHAGPAGTIGGVTSSDSVKLQVTSAAGPFVVTSPNAALTWAGGSSQAVTWDVAGTAANGVNCAAVNVRLSTDGGLTYPTVLAAGVPNAGTATVTVPAVATATARIMVEAADNVFFDISNANFTITSPAVCAPPTAVTVGSITNTGAQVSFTPAAGATRYLVTTTPATAPQTVTASPVTLTGLTPGTTYTVSVVTDCGSGSTSVAATATFTTTAPPVCNPPSELAASNVTLTGATLTFVGSASATGYTITTTPATAPQTVTGSTATLTGLTPATTYTVNVVSNCAGGATSPAATLRFRTLSPPPANDQCANALPLACGVRVTGSTEGATATGDPTGSCVGTDIYRGGVFYRLTGTGGNLTVSTCGPATDFDTQLFVFRGACGNYTCVASNDDTQSDSCYVASALTFPSVAGTPYLVFVAGYAGTEGNFELLATCAPLSRKSATNTAFQVWPNPAGARAAFRVTLPAPAASATATLHNVVGQRVAQRTFQGATTKLPTAGLAPGTYLLTVHVAGQAPAVRRVVIE